VPKYLTDKWLSRQTLVRNPSPDVRDGVAAWREGRRAHTDPGAHLRGGNQLKAIDVVFAAFG
jgi:hypothetical protein